MMETAYWKRCTRLHGIIYLKTVVFIITDLGTLNLTAFCILVILILFFVLRGLFKSSGINLSGLKFCLNHPNVNSFCSGDKIKIFAGITKSSYSPIITSSFAHLDLCQTGLLQLCRRSVVGDGALFFSSDFWLSSCLSSVLRVNSLYTVIFSYYRKRNSEHSASLNDLRTNWGKYRLCFLQWTSYN
jgi:hypothetical protein